MTFQQESGIPDKVESEPAAHAEKEGTEREILQVIEDGFHKSTKESSLLHQDSSIPIATVVSQDQGAGLGHQQHREILARETMLAWAM